MIELASKDEDAAAEFSEGVAAESFEDLNDKAKAEDEDEDEVEDGMFEDLDRKAGAEGDGEKPKKKKRLNPLERMNEKHAFVVMNGKSIVLHLEGKLAFGTVADLNLLYANDVMPTRDRRDGTAVRLVGPPPQTPDLQARGHLLAGGLPRGRL